MSNKKLNVVIVGGSLSGLMHGIVLRRLGHNVRILERSELIMQESRGAGIALMEEVQKFMENLDTSDIPYSVTSPNVQFLDRTDKIKSTWKVQVQMSSWNILYYRLRSNFDGLVSELYPEPLNQASLSGSAIYEHGKNVIGVEYVDGLVTVTFEGGKNGDGSISADLVIAADGASSKLRQILQPNLKNRYAGYVAWRGTVLESLVSTATREKFASKTTFFVLNRGYVVLYTIPGEDGSVTSGQRQMNWLWYCSCPEDSQEFIDVMTDIEGHRHRNTLPIGNVNPEQWSLRKALALRDLPPPFSELVQKTTKPFISAINDFDISQPSFFDGKLLFVGDALATFRPHIASSTNQAALDADLVGRLVSDEINLAQWEDRVLQFAHLTTIRSQLWGAYYMFGVPTAIFVSTLLQYGRAVATQWFRQRWGV